MSSQLRKNRNHVISGRRKNVRRKFEPLEDRRLLATLTVTTTIDRPLDTSITTLAHCAGVDGKLTLREAIYLANINPGPDTVVLKPKSTYSITAAGAGEDADVTGDFDILDNLTIKGGSKTIINGNGLDRVFDIPVDNISVTLDHVVVTGGIARDGDGGGGVQGKDGETLKITSSSITGNIATTGSSDVGGGIFLDSGNLSITNSHIDGNSAAGGIDGRGGAIFIDAGAGLVTILNSTVSGNSAYEDSGAISSGLTGAFTITNSQINNNHSGDGGSGAVFSNAGLTTITSSTFSGNTTSGEGGGLSADGDLSVIKSTFCNNTAVGDGGAVWSNQHSVNVSNSTFKDNSSTGGAGGALGNIGAVTVTGSTFNHNTASGVGGAIDEELEVDITITGSTFTNNSAGDTGGAINGDGDADFAIRVTNSKFTYNTATNQGGAIAADGEHVVITGSTFDHNTSVNGDGGAIDDGIVTATNSCFTNNTSKADGGAIDSEDNNISLTACTFSGNTATNGEGGAFNDGGPDSAVSVINCTINGNTAGGNGGGFAAEGVTLTMTGSTVSGNRSGSDGGGAYIITSGTDTVAYPGGPVAPGSLIANCTFANNGSTTDGGGIDFEGDGDLTIINVTIAFNSSFNGGGIAQTNGSGTIHIGNTIVAKNNATNDPDAYDPASGTFDDLGHNLVFSDPDTVFTNGSDLIGIDPLLKALANNGGPTKTLALSKHSPAENAGDDSLAPLTDQRGVNRPRDGQSDIGAYEAK